VLLVAANVILIAAVVFLIVQLSNDSNGAGTNNGGPASGDTLAATDPAGATLVGPARALPMQAADALAEASAAGKAAVGVGAVDAVGEAGTNGANVEGDAKTEAGAEAGTPVVVDSAGALIGEALGALPYSVLEGELELVLRSQPPGAILTVAGFGSGPSPRTIRARRGVLVSGRATLADHAARTFEVVMGDEESHVVTMRAVPRGVVRFRFFPAEGTRVEIDGRPWPTLSNVVSAELSAGQHSLVLVAKSGKRVTRSIVIEEGKTTNIGTIDLAGE